MFRETKGMQEYIVYICMKKKELICTSKVAPKKVLLINVKQTLLLVLRRMSDCYSSCKLMVTAQKISAIAPQNLF